LTNIALLSATDMSRKMAAGILKSEQILDAVLEQIVAYNGDVNAVVTLDEAGSRARARRADEAYAQGQSLGPLHGIPVTIKDSYETAGLLTTAGFPPLKKYVPDQDATSVARLKAAGAVIVGKTNLPVLAGDFQTRNPIFGRSNNPWNVARTTGGSTGGGAAAVATGMSALELGSDLGGSARLPAHYCGISSFKPSATRISLVGHIPGSPAPGMKAGPSNLGFMAMPGVLARSAADLPLAMNTLAGADPRWADVPPLPVGENPYQSADALKGLRVAWAGSFPGVAVSADTSIAMRNAARDLQDAGCVVEECMPPGLDFAAAREAWGEFTGNLMGAGLGLIPRTLFRWHIFMNGDRSDMKRGVVRGLGQSFSRFKQACRQRDEAVAQVEDFLHDWDIWLCPVASGPAFTHSKTGTPVDIDGQRVEYLHAAGGHTALFNFTGNPVLVLPVGLSSDGLPIGVQLVARRWGDDRLLSLAAAFEGAIGAYRPPPLVAP
jgi:amidase